MENNFPYEKTLKTKEDDSFLNIQSFLYFSSKELTKMFYYTPITPHQVIFFSLMFGIAASILLIQDNIYIVMLGAVFLFYKNVLDKVDGSLARAKDMTSRRGRFYDSISDFIVSLSLFIGIGYKLHEKYNNDLVYFLSFAGLIFSMLQCSFFIYYQVAFIMQTGKNTINRLSEKITQEDILSQDKYTLFLQRLFLIIYGWQDTIVHNIDKFLMNRLKRKLNLIKSDEFIIADMWYRNKPFLTLASILSIGSHMFLIAVFGIAGRLEYYIFVNLILWNLLLVLAVIYQYKSIKNRIKRSDNGLYIKVISL